MEKEPNPLHRILRVVRWYLAFYCEIKLNHKPYNPVINESHQCTSSHEGSTAFCIAEQVSHHPPLSVVYIENPDKKLTFDGNISFTIKFGGNSASCESKGATRLNVAGEIYHISKGMPDILLTNVVIGTRINTWAGELEITCPSTGYRVTLKLVSKDSNSYVKGAVYIDTPADPSVTTSASSVPSATSSDGEELSPGHHGHHGHHHHHHKHSSTEEKTSKDPSWVFKGHWGDEPIYAKPFQHKNKEKSSGFSFWGSKKEKTKEAVNPDNSILVIDHSAMQKAIIDYPTIDQMDDTDSMLVWRYVSQGIVGDDLAFADIEKNKVENAQRARMKAGAQEGHERRFFTFSEESELWEYNGKSYTGARFLSDAEQTLEDATLAKSSNLTADTATVDTSTEHEEVSFEASSSAN